MKKSTKQFLSTMNVISWIIFLGLCIKTGAIIYSFFVSLAINPAGAENLHLGLNLSELYNFDKGHYVALVSMIIVLAAAKAYLFYIVIKIFLKINFVQPFSTDVSLLISRISYFSLGIGAFTLAANSYCEWLTKKGFAFPDLQQYLGAGGEFLLMGAIIFMIAQVFKRGIQIQSENELTV